MELIIGSNVTSATSLILENTSIESQGKDTILLTLQILLAELNAIDVERTLVFEEAVLETLTIWMLNEPGTVSSHPMGAGVSGIRVSVTPWGKGFARAREANATTAVVYLILAVSDQGHAGTKVSRPLSEGTVLLVERLCMRLLS